MSSLPTRDNLFREVVTRAVTSPVALFLTTFGGLLLLSPELWPAGVAGLGANAGWVWWRIRDSGYARECSEQMQRQRWRALISRLEELTTVLDHQTASALSS